MQRWEISETRLPPGSEVHFRTPTAWERYRWQLTFISIAMLVQAGMIAWLVIERHNRRKAETGVPPPVVGSYASEPERRSGGVVGVLCART